MMKAHLFLYSFFLGCLLVGSSGATSSLFEVSPQRALQRLERIAVDCDASLDCDLRRNGQVGSFVCRSRTHPITGELRSKAICVPKENALEGDVCGCCEDEAGVALECPARRDFQELDCPVETQPLLEDLPQSLKATVVALPETAQSRRLDLQVVCRELVNPYTGEPESKTLLIRGNLAVEGDVCGCCDGVCPEPGGQVFERPETVVKACRIEDPDNFVQCDLSPSVEAALEANGIENPQGFFVCRDFYDPRGLEEGSRQEPRCIPQGFARESDTCGCCGEECPERARGLDIECPAEAACEFRNGQEGVFVCRSIFHPFDGQLRERSFCIPPNRSWHTDVCGCCESGCPTRPNEGFESEETQLAVLALEIPEDDELSVQSGEPGEGDAAAREQFSVFLSLLLTMTAATLVAGGILY